MPTLTDTEVKARDSLQLWLGRKTMLVTFLIFENKQQKPNLTKATWEKQELTVSPSQWGRHGDSLRWLCTSLVRKQKEEINAGAQLPPSFLSSQGPPTDGIMLPKVRVQLTTLINLI